MNSQSLAQKMFKLSSVILLVDMGGAIKHTCSVGPACWLNTNNGRKAGSVMLRNVGHTFEVHKGHWDLQHL